MWEGLKEDYESKNVKIEYFVVSALVEVTGCGIMAAINALEHCNGDLGKATEYIYMNKVKRYK